MLHLYKKYSKLQTERLIYVIQDKKCSEISINYCTFYRISIFFPPFSHLFNVSAPFLHLNMSFERLDKIYFSFSSRFLTFCSIRSQQSIHIIKQSPPPRLSVCLSAINSTTTERIFMRFSPIDRVILPENTGI